MKNYRHLSWNDRLTIERMLLKKYPKKAIADAIGCSLGTIYNELARAKYIHTNSDLTNEERYSPDLAEQRYRQMLKKKGKKPLIIQDKKLCQYISYMIKEMKYSPEAILLELNNNKGVSLDIKIKSVNTIYDAIKKGYIPGITMEYLPRRGKKIKRKKSVTTKKAAKVATIGISIEKRPSEINYRETFGHWEMDCVIGKSKNKTTLLVLTERLTRYEIIEKLKAHNTSEVIKALNRIEKRFKSSFYKIFKSITVDNGSEFKDFYGMEKALYRKGKRTNVYYCHPYAPHERGSNENANHLIRRFFSKGIDFDKEINRNKIKVVEYWINTYPRKILKGYTAEEIFLKELKRLGYSLYDY